MRNHKNPCFSLIMMIFTILFFQLAFANSPNNDSSSSDSIITSKIKGQLLLNRYTKSRNIKVTTENGVVSLDGTVSDLNEAITAIQIAASVNGVSDVDTSNLILTSKDATAEDSYINAKIKGGLIREKLFNDINLPSASIKINTKEGVVYLFGFVKNKDQENKIITIAQNTNGVKRVVSRLKISDNS